MENFRKKSKKRNSKENNISTIKLLMPRDVQNANSLIISKINLNKFCWDKDGEKVNQLFIIQSRF
jgi:hypothetical protein